MYRPEQFQEDRTDVLLEAIRSVQLAALVTPGPEGMAITHVPMVAKREGGKVTLETHVARANPHWRTAGESVAIFQGPHAYVSPSFYPSKREHGKVVPTWTYITVHAYGRLEAMDDADWLRAHLEELTIANESERPAPWKVDDAPERFVSTLSRGIVGLRLTVDRLEGAWKLNQHKSDADRTGTAEGLAASGPMGTQLSAALTAGLGKS